MLDEERGGTYKYLRIAQVFQPDHKVIQVKLTGVYKRRLHKIWVYSQCQARGPRYQYVGVYILLLPGQVAGDRARG